MTTGSEKPNSVVRNLARQIASPRFGTILLVAFIALSTLGTAIPQESLYPREEFLDWQTRNPAFSRVVDTFALTDLYRSPAYIVVGWLLMLSVALCTWRRLLALVKRSPPPSPGTPELYRLPHLRCLETSLPAAELLRRLEDVSLGRGWGRWKNGRPPFRFERGRAGVWGSLIFHFSFLLVLAGSLASTWSRAEGTVVLTEGETFDRQSAGYYQRSDPGRPVLEPPDFQVTLRKVRPSRSEKSGPFSDVLVREPDGRSARRSIGNFHALSHGGYTFYQTDQGYSPALRITDPGGAVLFDGFVAFHGLEVGETKRASDAFIVPGTGLRIEGTLDPGDAGSSPALKLQVAGGERTLFEGVLPLHGQVALPHGEIVFSDLRRWTSLRVVRDRGVPVLYAGFLVGGIGLCLRVFSRREEIWIRLEEGPNGCTLLLAGRSEGESALFAERFERLCQKFETHLQRQG